MLSTVGRFIYTTYWGILYVERCGEIYLHKMPGNMLCWTLWEDLFKQISGEYFMLNTACGKIYFTKYRRILYIEHYGEMYRYVHKMYGNTLCWALWEDFFAQNTEEYFMLNTVVRFIYTNYWGILYVEHCGKIYLHKVHLYYEYFMLNTVGRFIDTKYWGILYVAHCGKIYLHKVLWIQLCWILWEDLFTTNTGEYFMLNTVERFIYTKYWRILHVE